ncbi:MAG: 50S ribosomal protein L24 [Phycisphaeraceae bacterium]|nr:50S ribosomal protein L24 [Phycisphaeraceae bacterium]
MARHVRRDDMVMVIAGDDRGRQGKVLKVLPDEDRVIVEGINVRQRNVRPTQQNPQGGQVEKEQPIHISNVQPVVDGKPTRVRFETKDDGSKVRVAVRNGEQVGPPLRKAKS